MRTGIGYDIHRLIPTVDHSVIRIGGVDIPCYFKVKAHSDGDVILHAVVDAILGALALGDIGQRYPDSRPENHNRPSHEFVTEVMSEVRKMGWRVHNVDTIVLLEEPKLAPHADAIRRRLADLLGTELTSISVKAKTMEGLGPIGERKALAAHASVVLKEI